ncbi:MAG: hypothetical protein V4773_00515 [Verrucomicrobiota bacterium]
MLSAILALSRRSRWVLFVWLPGFVVSVLFSLAVAPLLLTGGYGFLALPVWGTFILTTLLLFFTRPVNGLGRANCLIGSALFGAVGTTLFFVPRPHATTLYVRILEGERMPLAHTSVPVTVYGGLGGNSEMRLRTDATGVVTFRVYGYESGSLTLDEPADPRRKRIIRFEPWGPGVGGLPNGYKFDGKDVVAANSDQIFTIYWADRRDLTQRRTEPMHVFHATGHLETSPGTLVLNVESGKFGDEGDLAFTFTRGTRWEGNALVHQVVAVVVARAGAALHVADGRYLDVAPTEGYVDQVTFTLSHRGAPTRFLFSDAVWKLRGLELRIYGQWD